MLRVLASLVRKPTSRLLVENPDDLALVAKLVPSLGTRFAILGGAGVDPEAFPALTAPANDVPIAAHVGRMASNTSSTPFSRMRLARRAGEETLRPATY